jgi:hypothetical protein
MINRLIHFLKQFDNPVSTKSFALFRILFAFYSLGIIYQLNDMFPIYFDHVPGISKTLFPGNLTLFVWKWTNILLLLGIFTRYIAAVNYILIVLMTAFFANSHLGSFNDDLLRIGSFLLIFMPVSKNWSVDALFRGMTRQDNRKQTYYIYYLLSILLSVGLLYFASGITKVFSPMWQKGIGIWIPAVIPHYRWNSLPFFQDQQWLMYSLNYCVIAFELSFIYLLFHKKLHTLMVVLGIGFHIGIALLFPFTYISVGPIMFYTLLIPDWFWAWWDRKTEASRKYTLGYGPARYSNILVVRITQFFDLRKRFIFTENTAGLEFGGQTGWNALSGAWSKNLFLLPASLMIKIDSIKTLLEYAREQWLPGRLLSDPNAGSRLMLKRFSFFVFTALLCGIQLFYVTYHTYSTFKAKTNPSKTYMVERTDRQYFSTKPSNLARTFFGINSRGVFLDHGFKGTKTVFAMSYTYKTGKQIWIPLFDTLGYCQSMNRNMAWGKITYHFLVSGYYTPDTNGLKKFTWVWANKKHIPLADLHLTVYRKRYTFPSEFEKGYLDKMLHLQWDTAGLIHWKDTVFHYTSLVPDSLNR